MVAELEVLKLFASICASLKGTPLALLIIFMFIGPWIAMLVISHVHGKRMQHAIDMYQESIEAAKIAGECCKDYKEVMLMTIEKLTKVMEYTDKNLFCPVVRKQTGV